MVCTLSLRCRDPALSALYGVALSQTKELDAALTELFDNGASVIKPEQLSYLFAQLTGTCTLQFDLQSFLKKVFFQKY